MKNNSTQRADAQQTTVNSNEPGVNDELAMVNDSKSTVDSLESAASNQNFGVNDDLALCSAVVSPSAAEGFPQAQRESIVVSKELSTENDPRVTTTHIRPRPNKNDPDTSGSFSFLHQIILQPIFNAVELFQTCKQRGRQNSLQLIPVPKKNRRYISR